MRRIPSLHALPAVAVAAASLVLPFLSADGATYTAADTSAIPVKAKAASVSPDQQFPVGGPAIQSAKEVALRYWGTDACGGNVQMTWVPMEAGTNATASWRNPTDAWNNAGANFDCKIDINVQAAYDFPKLCTVLTHELGHLNGQQHVEAPGQLMSAYYTDSIPQCVSADPNPPVQQQVEPLGLEASAPSTTTQRSTAKKQQLRKTAAKKSAKKTTKKAAKRRCVTRFKAGKRVKRCTTVKTSAKRASKKAARS